MRNLHLIGLTQEELETRHNARLVAVVLLVALFTGLIAFTPEGQDTTPTVAVNVATD